MKTLPLVRRVRQQFEYPRVNDIEATVRARVLGSRIRERIPAGGKVAVAVGSRGIAQLARIVSATVRTLGEMGYQPFIVAGMGTHGGGTSEGQRQLLADYGVTESAMGVAIRTEMESVQVGVNELGAAVYWDRNAWEADGVVAVNRVKAHTDFIGPIESGIIKMLVIGLGKRESPEQVHALGGRGMARMVPASGKVLLQKTRFALGLAILENANEETALIQAMEPENLFEEEPKLLEKAKSWMARLPFHEAEVLIVGELGKNYSGTGMDTNVLGRRYVEGEPDFPSPKIIRVAVLDVSAESHGNAVGVGLADLTTTRLVNSIDHAAMRLNTLVSRFLLRSRIPLTFDTDREVLETCLETCWEPDRAKVRLAVIPNTLELTEIYVTDALLGELIRNDNKLTMDDPQALPFTDDGRLDQVTLFPHARQGVRAKEKS